jgi:hypothetical protein
VKPGEIRSTAATVTTVSFITGMFAADTREVLQRYLNLSNTWMEIAIGVLFIAVVAAIVHTGTARYVRSKLTT